MKDAEWLEELEAQIEDHGRDKVLFLLEDDNGKVLELYIQNVSFDGTYINVKLGLPT